MISVSIFRKRTFLLGGFLSFICAWYNFALSDTISIIAKNSTQEEKVRWMHEQGKTLPVLREKISTLNKLCSSADSSVIRAQLTAFVSAYAHKSGCVVTEIPSVTVSHLNNLRIQTNSFTVRGNYLSLLSLLFSLENMDQNIAKVVSARYFSSWDHEKKTIHLYLTIHLQSFIETHAQ